MNAIVGITPKAIIRNSTALKVGISESKEIKKGKTSFLTTVKHKTAAQRKGDITAHVKDNVIRKHNCQF